MSRRIDIRLLSALLLTFGMGSARASSEAGESAPQAPHALLQADAVRDYVQTFNSTDHTHFGQAISNEAAADWMAGNVPRFECPDEDIEEIYHFRWWTFRKHIKLTEDGFVITEFLPKVNWSGKHNTISCPAGHHFREGRWIHDPQYLDNYAVFWFRQGGSPRRYSFWAADAIYRRALVQGDFAQAIDLLPDLVTNYEAWEQSRLEPDGLFWQIDDRDGMEVSIGGKGHRGQGKRATINSYMYGDAVAIAAIAQRADKPAIAKTYTQKAEQIEQLVLDKLWDDDAKFFKVLPRNEEAELVDVRELHGFTPWYFNLPDPGQGYEVAWKQLMDRKGFYAPFGPTTAEQRHPEFSVSYTGHECQWNGPSWPFATTVTLVALANVLNDYPQTAVSSKDYFETLKIYTKSHRLTRKDGAIVPWIDENLNPHTGDWIARSRLKVWKNGTWDPGKGGVERGKDYNHSSYCDLIITGLVGLRPQANDTIVVNPLIPDGVWDYFCLDGVPYHGRMLTILYDKTGKKYGKGCGLRILADGKEIGASETLERLTALLPAKQIHTPQHQGNAGPHEGHDRDSPNILFCLADDQSYPHASAYGEPVIKTPVFDRIAREGVLFTHAYCAAPSCTPSRSAILTGQDIWRLGQGGQLFGTLPAQHPVYTDLLTESGYHVGYSDKGWAPGNVQAGGRTANPAGPSFKNFQEFFSKAPEGKPWCFWFGSRDPHRGYRKGSGVEAGMDPAKVRVPEVFPDTPEVRSDICDYFFEIQRFDQQIGEMLKLIEQSGQLDNTLVVITSDNGMPFPRAKANLYDLGTRMPLAIRWPKQAPGGRTVDDFVNLTDLAPTFLEAAGLKPPKEMTGHSLANLLKSTTSGIVEPTRDAAYAGRERHAWCRIDGKGYPARMIRTRDFLYIRNYDPERWPAGTHRIVTNEGHYGDIDASPTKDVMIEQKNTNAQIFERAFGKRPRDELYDCGKDPYQLHNLASDPAQQATMQKLSARLTAHLKATGDPRETTGETPWDNWPYYGNNRWKILPEQAADAKTDARGKVPKTTHFDPVVQNMEGWTVHVDPQMLEGEHAEAGARALTMLANHLQRIAILMPEDRLEEMRKLDIWIEHDHPEINVEPGPYHPDVDWLTARGYDPRLAKKVHITRAASLLERHHMIKHPAVILHELAHAYHHQVLGFDEPRIKAAYKEAMKAGIYDEVLLYTGKKVRAYAANNHMEYFAEGTEAYFYRNDFYPFVRAELKEHDSLLHDLLEEIWGRMK